MVIKIKQAKFKQLQMQLLKIALKNQRFLSKKLFLEISNNQLHMTQYSHQIRLKFQRLRSKANIPHLLIINKKVKNEKVNQNADKKGSRVWKNISKNKKNKVKRNVKLTSSKHWTDTGRKNQNLDFNILIFMTIIVGLFSIQNIEINTMQTALVALDKLLGEGSYSWVYSLKNSSYAIKISKIINQSLTSEYQIIDALSKTHPSLFPKIFAKQQYTLHQGVIGLYDGFNEQRLRQQCLVMQRLGISLEQFMNLRGHINLQAIKRIGQSILSQLSVLLENGISHNDIKPANVLFGLAQKRSKVYLIDYGFASISNHSESIQNNTFKGNMVFSATQRMKNNISQKNDLQSFIYLMLWILRDGNLPWQQLSQNSFQRKVEHIIKIRADFIQATLETTINSFSERDILIHQLVSILSLIKFNQRSISANNLLQKLKILF